MQFGWSKHGGTLFTFKADPLGEMGDPYLQEIEQKFLCALKEIMPFQILNVIYRNAKHH